MTTPTFTGSVPPPPRKPLTNLELPMPLRLEVGDVFAIPHKAGDQRFTVTETGYEPFDPDKREWPIGPLAAPVKLRAIPTAHYEAKLHPTGYSVDLSWDTVQGAMFYELQRSVGDGDWHKFHYCASNDSISDGGINAYPSRVRYRIRAHAPSRVSHWTESALVLIPALRDNQEAWNAAERKHRDEQAERIYDPQPFTYHVKADPHPDLGKVGDFATCTEPPFPLWRKTEAGWELSSGAACGTVKASIEDAKTAWHYQYEVPPDVSSTARRLRHTLRHNTRRLSADLQRFTSELYATKRPKGKRRRRLEYQMADTLEALKAIDEIAPIFDLLNSDTNGEWSEPEPVLLDDGRVIYRTSTTRSYRGETGSKP